MKFEENWPMGFREVIQRCGRMTDDRRTENDGRQVSTITHSELSAELKNNYLSTIVLAWRVLKVNNCTAETSELLKYFPENRRKGISFKLSHNG